MKILEKKFEKNDTMTTKMYNECVGFFVVFGLILNLLMCLGCKDLLPMINTVGFCILYLILSFVAIIILTKTENKGIMLLSYFMIVVPTSFILSSVLNAYHYNPQIVIFALIITIILTACMCILGILHADFFLKIGNTLVIGIFVLLITYLISILFHFNIPGISWISATLFSLLIGYDLTVAQSVPKTFKNAIFSSINIYLDIINIFLDVLDILNKDN